MKIVVFEDNQCHRLYPIGLFRPLHELRIGSWNLGRIISELGESYTTITRSHFNENEEAEYSSAALRTDGESVLFLNASIEPDVSYIEKLKDVISSGNPFLSTSGNRVAAALVPSDKKLPDSLCTATMRSELLELNLPLEEELFATIDWPHEAVESHLRLFRGNLEATIQKGEYTETQPGLFTKGTVSIAPSAVIDTSHGPVVMDDGVEIKHFSYIEGPVFIGSHSRVIEHSAIKDNSSVGVRCKIGGEVEASVISSYSNKQHHGFLGHSWVGRWVNLGAGTSTSDLKNTYGKVNMEYSGKRVTTGMQFIGSIIGDYAKSAINSTIFTGKLIGACSMIYGTVTTNVPSFANYARSFGQITEVRLGQILKTQERMFARRDVTQTERDITLMNRIFELTKHERTMSEEQINF